MLTHAQTIDALRLIGADDYADALQVTGWPQVLAKAATADREYGIAALLEEAIAHDVAHVD